MRKFKKMFTREAGLLAIEVWYKNEICDFKKCLGWAVPKTGMIFRSVDGVTEIYYHHPDVFDEAKKRISLKLKDDKFLTSVFKEYKEKLSIIKSISEGKKPLDSREKLIDFLNIAIDAWSGLNISYLVPDLSDKQATSKQKSQALAVRKETDALFEDIDRVSKSALRRLYPEIGELVDFISIADLKNNKIEKAELEARSKQFIIFNDKFFTKISFKDFLKKEGFSIDEDLLEEPDVISGTIVMKGIVRGTVKLVLKKKQISEVQDGEVLVTHMTTPDFLPAMKKSAAFITDEGGVMCHAAIVAREMGKPCIIGTKIATQVLKDGDMVEVDANKGVVRIL